MCILDRAAMVYVDVQMDLACLLHGCGQLGITLLRWHSYLFYRDITAHTEVKMVDGGAEVPRQTKGQPRRG